MASITIAQWGLIADIIGVLILFKFGLPSEYIVSNKKLLDVGNLEGEELNQKNRHNRKIEIGSYTGLTLILLGFILQFIGSV